MQRSVSGLAHTHRTGVTSNFYCKFKFSQTQQQAKSVVNIKTKYFINATITGYDCADIFKLLFKKSKLQCV